MEKFLKKVEVTQNGRRFIVLSPVLGFEEIDSLRSILGGGNISFGKVRPTDELWDGEKTWILRDCE